MSVTPSCVDHLRALLNERAQLVAERIAIESRVSLLDAELAEVRHLLGAPPLGSIKPNAAPEIPRQSVDRRESGSITPAASEPPTPVAEPEPSAGRDDNQRRQAILALLQAGPKPTRVLAAALKIDRLVCKMALQRMKKVGLVQTIGVRNGQRWMLATRPSAGVLLPTVTGRTLADAVARPVPKVDAALIDARDATVLRRVADNHGVATIQELRRWFVKSAVAGEGPEATQHEALHNALYRLKAKGRLARTGDTWSLPGAGVACG